MSEPAPLRAEDARDQLDRLSTGHAAVDRDLLTAVHDVLRSVTAGTDQAPTALLERAALIAQRAEVEVVDSLPPRALVVARLLRGGHLDAAWLVVVDNATGFVAQPFHASTSSGADRTAWSLPLLTTVEPPHVYAELPAFRDPRFGVPDELFDIEAMVRLRCRVDDVVPGHHPTLSGWCALDHLTTDPDETVTLVATLDDREVRWSGRRQRRADLVGGNRESIRRRAWAGWAVEARPEDLSEAGRWMLWMELIHRGLHRRVRLGRAVDGLATSAVGRRLSERPATRLQAGPGGWSIVRG